MSRAPTETQRALLAAVAAGLDPLRAVAPQSLSRWAAEHFYLSAESSHTQGRWTAYPFQAGWMDAFSNDDIEEVTVRKAKRVGYTKTLLAFIAYNAAHRRRKQALWQPTDDDRDSFVKSEIDPMLRDVAAMRPVTLSGKEDTLKLKQFLGSVLHTLGGKAARAYRRITVAVAMLDEASAFDHRIEKSSDPITLARGRLEGAPFPKLIAGSTPRIKGLDHIEYREQNADAQMRYHVTCPHCQADHPLMWGGSASPHGFKWDDHASATVRHVCPHCRGAITQADYLRIWADGAWVSQCGAWRYGADSCWRNPAGEVVRPPRHVAFHVWTAYSPQRAWPDIVREFLEATEQAARGDTGPLEGFVNETLGELWEEKGESADEHALQLRAEDYPLCVVPAGALVLTAGVDLQGNRCEIGVWGWGAGMESWDIDHHIIELNPSAEDDWSLVEQYLLRRYPQAWANGEHLPLEAVTIDSNFQTQAVYNFVRKMQHRIRIYAGRGDNQLGSPIKGPGRSQEVTWKGQRWTNGIKQWTVGVDSAKDLLHGQLQILTPGPGYVHLNKHRPREWFEQLTAEQRVPVRGPTGTVERWVKRRARNEVLDCRNLALHAAYMLGLNYKTEAQWRQIEAAVQPPADLFTQPAQAPAAQRPQTEAQQPRVPPPRGARAPAAAGRAW